MATSPFTDAIRLTASGQTEAIRLIFEGLGIEMGEIAAGRLSLAVVMGNLIQKHKEKDESEGRRTGLASLGQLVSDREAKYVHVSGEKGSAMSWMEFLSKGGHEMSEGDKVYTMIPRGFFRAFGQAIKAKGVEINIEKDFIERVIPPKKSQGKRGKSENPNNIVGEGGGRGG